MAFADVRNRLNATVLGRFGVAALLDGVSVVGDFADGLREHDVGGMPLTASEPMFTLADADVPADVVGKAFVHDGTTYEVCEVRGARLGLTVLVLQKTF